MTTTQAPPDRPARSRSESPAPTTELDAVEPILGGEAVAIPSVGGLVRGLLATIARPGPLTREAGHVLRDLTEIAKGSDRLMPAPKDKRFADPAWRENPLYKRLGQGYHSLAAALTRLSDSYEDGAEDWHDVERARFAVNALTSLLSPTNTLAGNPAALKRVIDTGGLSAVRGLRYFVDDLRHNGGMPRQTDRSAFVVGRDLALTPGAVISRDAVAEIIEYRPTTGLVRERPLLVIPPPIGRFYFLDLRPGRSFVEYAVSRGLRVFLISWRNPGVEQADWDIETYAGRIRSTIEVVKTVSGSPDINTIGFCAGGILQTTVLSHLAQTGDASVHSAGYAVTLLDLDSRAPIGAFSSPRLLEMARKDSSRRGLITARSLGSVFSWMRPDDLVFNYVVNQWVMGNPPPVFDILAWNADGTNLPAKLHEDFLDIFRENTLMQPGALKVLGTPVDLSTITIPTFVTGALNDHLTPWKGCYRTTSALSGPSTFVLSSAGHIASLVNPPGNPKASYYVGGTPGPDPEEWRAGAEQRVGSWWEAWADWVLARSGDEQAAPSDVGAEQYPPLDEAPGRYVVDRAPTG